MTGRNDIGLALKKKDYRYIKDLAYFSSLGLQMAFAIFIGLWFGRFLDSKCGTDPWLTVIFFVLGVAAAYKNIGLAIKKLRKF